MLKQLIAISSLLFGSLFSGDNTSWRTAKGSNKPPYTLMTGLQKIEREKQNEQV